MYMYIPCTYIYTYIHVHIHMYMYIHVYIIICSYMYIHVFHTTDYMYFYLSCLHLVLVKCEDCNKKRLEFIFGGNITMYMYVDV